MSTIPVEHPSHKRIALADAVELLVLRQGTPVLTSYILGRILFDLFKIGHVDGRKLRIQRPVAFRDYALARDELLRRNVLLWDRSIPGSVLIVQHKNKTDVRELLCIADPFGYISHQTAMAYHGLTNRIPRIVFYTTLYPSKWNLSAKIKMQKDLGESQITYQESGLPLLRKPKIEKTLGTSVTQIFAQDTMGAYRLSPDSSIRVSTIGRTFLDMVRRPELCGGMSHVIEIFEEHGAKNSSLIINEVNSNGNKIERIRTGYLLEQVCQVRDDKIEEWVSFAQRGGSRKLDPHSPYSEEFSERWMISINV